MVTCKTGDPSPEIVGDSFWIEHRNESYPCRAIRANGRILFEVKFHKSKLYITKTINQHGIPFWTAIPQDLKLRHLVAELGRQLEDHLIEALCVTTTALKSPARNTSN
jgi:hypothetical protein